jgi:hypothetical protein
MASCRLGWHRYHPIAARVLRLKQVLVGCRDQLLGAKVAFPKQRGHAAADADKRCRGRVRVRNVQPRDRASSRLGDPSRGGKLGVGKDDGKLLTAVSRNHVGRTAAAGLQRRRHLLQALIACLVSIVIVVGLEGIHIAHDEGQNTLLTVRDGHLTGKIGIEETPVGKTRQPVVQGQLLERLVGDA